MDGAAHYRAAEEAYEKARGATEHSPRDVVDRYLNAAQFHALMAIAAAATKSATALARVNPVANAESHTALGEICGFETGMEF
jgi:hypothetical protein